MKLISQSLRSVCTYHYFNMSNKKSEHVDRCCNPFNTVGHKGKHLRSLSKNVKREFPDLPYNSMICHSCRKMKDKRMSGSSDSLDKLNGNVSKTNSVDYNEDVDDFYSRDSTFSMDCSTYNEIIRSEREMELEDMLSGLKQKFSSLKITDPLRVRILTIAPQSWSISQISKEFNCSRRIAKRSKVLRDSEGILAETTVKKGKVLTENTVKKVKDFYNDDMNGRIMPGKKDVVSVKTDEGRSLIQKRLLLLDLKGLFNAYNECHQDYPVSFSKFAELRPKHCVLAGSSGTHSVCVCTIHENTKLMLDAVNIKSLTDGSENPIIDYKDCLRRITCVNSSDKCFLGECNNCPLITDFSEFLLSQLDEKNIDYVQYTTWTATDRSTLKTETLSTYNFVEELCHQLERLKPHSFIAKQQSQFFENKKNNLIEGEILVTLDFSENYKYIVQDASQAFHFNNDQCTLFPVVCYYKEESELKHESLVFLSDSMKHDTAAVYTVQKMLIPYLKSHLLVTKIIYFSDGAKQHFKNKFQIINLIHHEKDFGVKAEWHVHATAHGKSASDGIGALFKREAARYSLLCKPNEAILTPEKLLLWSQTHFKSRIKTLFYSKKEHDKSVRFLNSRFQKAKPVPEISKNHSFLVENNQVLLIKRYSSAPNGASVHY